MDIYARILARLIAPDLGQNVIVDNRPGGSGIPMINAMVRAPADGYVIAATTVTLATLFGEKNANFKPQDLQMVARSQIDPFGIVVHASTPFKSIKQFVAMAKQKPGYINLGGPLTMSSHRVAFELFSEATGIKAEWVAYKGGGQVLTAIAGGEIDAAHTNPGNAKPFVESGRIRLLAVSSEQRLADFPAIPTYRESGYDLVRYNWRGIVTKSGMPKPAMDKLSTAIEKAQIGGVEEISRGYRTDRWLPRTSTCECASYARDRSCPAHQGAAGAVAAQCCGRPSLKHSRSSWRSTRMRQRGVRRNLIEQRLIRPPSP